MRVSPRVRAVLYLHIVEDMPYEAVAAALGCRPEAARKAGSRGLRDLRALFDVSEGDGL
jgi:DNA-directed RNA polymerase specialized sigma24 family protein